MTRIPGRRMTSFFKKAFLGIRSHLWAVDNYWFRLGSIRYAVLRLCLRARSILAGEGAGRKTALISDFAGSLSDDAVAGHLFDDGLTPAEAPAGEREHWRKEFPVGKKSGRSPGFLVPNEAFRSRLRDYLIGFTAGGEERMFRLDDLVALEKKRAVSAQKPDHAQRIFTRRAAGRDACPLRPGHRRPLAAGIVPRLFFPCILTRPRLSGPGPGLACAPAGSSSRAKRSAYWISCAKGSACATAGTLSAARSLFSRKRP